MIFCGCSDKEEHRYFDIATGEKVFCSFTDFGMPTSATLLSISEGYYPVSMTAGGYILVNTEMDGSGYYGLLDNSGTLIIEPEYTAIDMSGNFILAKKEGNEEFTYDFFYKDGSVIPITIDDTDLSIYAVSDKLFAVCNSEDSQVFDKSGNAYFLDMLSSNTLYTEDNDLLLAYNNLTNQYLIYDISDGYAHFLKGYHSSSSMGLFYNVSYLGEGVFLAVLNYTTTEKDGLYKVDSGTGSIWYNQSLYLYNGRTQKESSIKRDFHIISVTNRYSPNLEYSVRQNYSLNGGYSSIWVANINSQKYISGYTPYVINKDCQLVLKIEGGIAADNISFVGDKGYTANAVGDALVVYSLDGSIKWRNSQQVFISTFYNNGYIIASINDEKSTKYGVFDIEGGQCLDFTFDFITRFTDGYALGYKDNNWYYLDTLGNQSLIQDIYTTAIAKNQFYTFVFRRDDGLGVKNYKGEELISPDYNKVVYNGYSGKEVYYILSDGESNYFYRLQSE